MIDGKVAYAHCRKTRDHKSIYSQFRAAMNAAYSQCKIPRIEIPLLELAHPISVGASAQATKGHAWSEPEISAGLILDRLKAIVLTALTEKT